MAHESLFTDVDLAFLPNPISGDIGKKLDDNAIKQSLKILLLSMFYERPFHSELGSPIRAMLFEPITPMLGVTMQKHIEQVISNYEPRVEIQEVEVLLREEQNTMEIKLYYTILNTSALQTFDLILERTR